MKKILLLPVLALAFVLGGTFLASAATTTLVTGNTSAGENMPGWMFNRALGNATPFEMNTDQASIGMGSLYVLPIGTTPVAKFIGENFINTAVADIDSISYDFRIGSGGVASQAGQFYMNVYANFGESPDNKYYDCRYDVVPTVGSISGFTTVTFDPTMAYPVVTRTSGIVSPFTCPAVPADMDILSAGSNVRAFSLNVGDTSAGDVDLDGYLDNVVVDTVSGIVVSDFEPILTPQTKDACKEGGWMTFNTPTFKNQGACVSSIASMKP